MITLDELYRIDPRTKAKAPVYLEGLNTAMREFEIDQSFLREAAFLAQILHESGGLRYVRELASGDAYDTGRLAARLGNTPEADGDGPRYKGRGLIQITGRRNYLLCGMALDVDLLAQPELLEQPVLACRSAGWFWHNNGCNALADKEDFLRITKVINGGANGWAERKTLYDKALVVLAA